MPNFEFIPRTRKMLFSVAVLFGLFLVKGVVPANGETYPTFAMTEFYESIPKVIKLAEADKQNVKIDEEYTLYFFQEYLKELGKRQAEDEEYRTFAGYEWLDYLSGLNEYFGVDKRKKNSPPADDELVDLVASLIRELCFHQSFDIWQIIKLGHEISFDKEC